MNGPSKSLEFRKLLMAARFENLAVTQTHDGLTAQVWIGPWCMMYSPRQVYVVTLLGRDHKELESAEACARYVRNKLLHLLSGSEANTPPSH